LVGLFDAGYEAKFPSKEGFRRNGLYLVSSNDCK